MTVPSLARLFLRTHRVPCPLADNPLLHPSERCGHRRCELALRGGQIETEVEGHDRPPSLLCRLDQDAGVTDISVYLNGEADLALDVCVDSARPSRDRP